MLLIFLCFLFSFLPLMLVNVFDDRIRFPVLNVLASILAWASSVMNPIIYAASNRQYRAAYSKLFTIIRSSVAFSDSRQLSGNSLKSRTEKNGQTVNAKQSSNNVQTSWRMQVLTMTFLSEGSIHVLIATKTDFYVHVCFLDSNYDIHFF